MGSWSFPGIKRLGHGIDHPPPSSAEVKERVELYLYSPSAPLWPLLGWNLPLPSNTAILQQQYMKSLGQLLVKMWWEKHILLSGFLNKNVGNFSWRLSVFRSSLHWFHRQNEGEKQNHWWRQVKYNFRDCWLLRFLVWCMPLSSKRGHECTVYLCEVCAWAAHQ